MSDFKAKCTKIDFGWGSVPDPAGGVYSATSSLNKGDLLLREGNGCREGKGREREGREEEGIKRKKRGREWRESPCVSINFP